MSKQKIFVFLWVVVLILIIIIGFFVKLSTDWERESFERGIVATMIEAHKKMWAIDGSYDYVFKLSPGKLSMLECYSSTLKKEELLNGVQKKELKQSIFDSPYKWYRLKRDGNQVFIMARMTSDFRESMVWHRDWKEDKNLENPEEFLRVLGLSDVFILTIKEMAKEKEMGMLHYLNWTYYGGN